MFNMCLIADRNTDTLEWPSRGNRSFRITLECFGQALENTGSGLDLQWGWDEANCEDTISWFDWFFSFFGLFVFRVHMEFWYRPLETASIHWISAFQAILSSQASSLHPEQQQGGHLDILTSPVTQWISGLCFCSQECPRMSFCLPKPMTANTVCSKWFQYLKMRSTTSVMEPASFGVPSTL